MNKEELLKGLNDRQYDAVTYTDGPVLVIAGAGSGKTKVLTTKIAYLIENKGLKPYQILAITFTNKAAKEMKTRVKSMVESDEKDLWIGTFHSICVRILRQYISKVGFESSFTICDEDDKEKLIKEIMKDLNIDDKQLPLKTVMFEIGSAKDKMIEPDKYIKDNKDNFRLEKVGVIYKIYQERLKNNNCIDFDDIINLTIKVMINNPEILEKLQNKFKYILVDEYQDTNKSQFTLISLLASGHGNICVVGDESQSIYGWRGADISNILNFEKEFSGTKVIKLEQNYRSTQTILNAANEVIKKNKSKLDKNLWTENGEGNKIKYCLCDNEYDEARYIVGQINKLRREEYYKFSDFAVLYRMNAQSRAIEEVLIRENIPYKIIGGLKFYSRKEIKDIVAYLRLIQNNNDSISLKRIINEPKRGIGNTTLENLHSVAIQNEVSLMQVINNLEEYNIDKISSSMIQFRDMIKDFNDKKDKITVSELIEYVLDRTGYLRMLDESKKDEANRIENIQELLGVSIEFENENAEANLEMFLENIALVSDTESEEEERDSITLMTLHTAKGLEFPAVFLIGMEEGLFPSGRALLEEREIEEERRLCYVGITRAKEILHLSHASCRTMYGSTSCNQPSRFLDEIPDKYYEEKQARPKAKTPDNYTSNVRVVSTEKGYAEKPKFGISIDSFFKNVRNENNTKKESVVVGEYKEGQFVEHKKFGKGKIVSLEPENDDLKLEIMFEEYGMKRLMAKFANLRIL